MGKHRALKFTACLGDVFEKSHPSDSLIVQEMRDQRLVKVFTWFSNDVSDHTLPSLLLVFPSFGVFLSQHVLN